MTQKISGTKEEKKNYTWFERAIFLSWYCSKRDCKFCYMSTLNNKDPKVSRRTKASIYAEAILAKSLGWKIEFLSGGYESFTIPELLDIIKNISIITQQKQWLNLGNLSYDELKLFYPYIQGIAGTLETPNLKLRRYLCPSKSYKGMLEMFRYCDILKLKKTITVIIGLGETLKDFEFLKSFIKKNNVSKITFYALNPHPKTVFKRSPSIRYYSKWIKQTRDCFPDIEIIAGAWNDKIDYYSTLLMSGANAITKLPALKIFGKKEAKNIELEAKKAGRIFKGTLTKIPLIDIQKELNVKGLDISKEEKDLIQTKLRQYLSRMRSNKDNEL